MKKHFGDVDPATLVMIGDRYSTDVLFGNLNGEIDFGGKMRCMAAL